MMTAHVTRVVSAGFSLAIIAVLLVVAGAAADRDPVEQTAQTQKKPGPPPGLPTPPADKKILEGGDEDDTLAATDGDDWLFGRKGNDFLRGSKGRDTIDGSDGDDILDGGADADILDGGAGSDTIRGAEGDDTLDAGDDDDFVDGGPGNDDLDGGDGNDTLRGGAGDDLISGGDNDDALDGGAGADRLFGNDEADRLSGGAGNDQLAGGDHDDVLSGDAGDDVLDGGHGADTLRGGAGNDILLGSWGADTLDGGEGYDQLLGGNARDTLNGGSGDDWLLGGLGADRLLAGDGQDLIVLRAGDVDANTIELVDGEDGVDVVILNGFRPGDTLGGPESRLTDPLTTGVYQLQNVERLEHTQLVTHAAIEKGQPASALLVNSATTAAEVRVLLFGDNGTPRAASIGGIKPQPNGAFAVPPLGSVRVELSADAPIGAAQFFSTSPLGLSMRAAPSASVAPVGEAALVDSAVIPVVEDQASGVRTGVAIFNSAVKSNIKLTLRTAAGQEVDDAAGSPALEIELPPNGRRVVHVQEAFPKLGNFRGTMTIEGGIDRPQEGGMIAVTGIERSTDGRVLATFPAIGVDPVPTTRTLHFPALPRGGDYSTSIVLANPSVNNPARGTLAFYDDAGKSWPVSLNGQAATASVSYNLAPGGSAVFTASAAAAAGTKAPPTIGSVRATATDGVAGAVMRVSTSNYGPLYVAATEAVTSFLTPARRDPVTGGTTELALASTGSAVDLQLTLRGANGIEAAGASTTLQLPANGRITRTLDQLFPTLTTAFDGTLTVTASGGTVAAMVTETSVRGSAAAVLPIVRLR